MKRWAAGVEYLGTAYAGWQALPGIRSVQATLEAALSTVADHPVRVVAAGRTDAGVHALQQVVHFDSAAERSAYAWLLGTNSCLPPDISLRWLQEVPQDFHARHRAFARRYRYLIHNHPARSASLYQRATWWPRRLDAEAMHAAAQVLVGEHDFSAFRDSQCQSPTPVRLLHSLQIWRRADFVVLDIRANAFLHHMVRNLAGTLAEVGWGRRPAAWVATVLQGADRRLAGRTAAPEGLYFVGPEYPAAYRLPDPPPPWFPA